MVKNGQTLDPVVDLGEVGTLDEVERALLPKLRDDFSAPVVVLYLFGRGPLEILHLGGLPAFQNELIAFHSAEGARWLKRVVRQGPVLREHCGMTAAEFVSSPVQAIVAGASPAHCRGLVISAKGQPLGLITLFRSAQHPAFSTEDDQRLLSYALPLSELFERLVHERSFRQAISIDVFQHLEEGLVFFDPSLRLTFANESGWSHLERVCRKGGAWQTLPPTLWRQLRLIRELERGDAEWAERPRLAPVVLHAGNGAEIRFRAFTSVNSLNERFFYLISSMVRTLPTASIDQVAERFGLTPREREVCAHLVEGKRNRDIAEAFGITEHTVKIHVRRVLGKLHVRSRSAVPGAVLKALTRWDQEAL